MSDYMVRILAKEAGLRGLACITTDLVNEARERHAANPAATAALAHGLTGAALLGALLKVRQRVALKVEGNGPLRKLVAEADSHGRVRGYVAQPQAWLPTDTDPLDTAVTLGHVGLLTVVKDLRLKELYEGVVPLHTGQLDSDLVFYLNSSEQVPSLVEIGVKLTATGGCQVAGGLLFQSLPDQEITPLRDLAERLDDLAPLGELLAAGQTPEQVLASLLTSVPYEILETQPLRFECSCSWQSSEQALVALGHAELTSLIDEGQAVVDCHFCHQRYIFGREALEMILERAEEVT
jgi:molecular chaperone Hsp33